jgi:glycosyltransferase involved in cell wall biosynthesis
MRQTCSHWRLIVVDEESGEVEWLWETLKVDADDRVRCLKNRAGGVTAALNQGMTEAVTPFVCSLHDDDELTLDACRVLRDYIERYPDIDYFHSARRRIDENGDFLAEVQPPKASFTPNDFISGGQPKHLHTWRVAKALQVGGMDESLSLHGADDYDFPWTMAEHGAVFHPVRECLYHYRDHRSAERLTTHVPLSRQVDELRKILRKHHVPELRIESELERRLSGYLRQALFKDEDDQERKLSDPCFDPKAGWRET